MWSTTYGRSGNVPWVSSKDLCADRIEDAVDHIDQDVAQAHSTVAPAGSVLVAVRGMALAKRLPLAILDRPMAFNQDLKGLVPIWPLVGEYLRIVLRAFEGEILSFVLESAHGTRRLATRDLNAFKFPLPSRREQRLKVDEVSEVEGDNAALATQINRHVELLEERRDALITAAVTGQLDPSSCRAPLVA
ncbi:MAG: restriction endonuclease subunit S [Actinobacteria bacterium]|nr:restriction endonuclease subunit S [Actinomycetota bacterium]